MVCCVGPWQVTALLLLLAIDARRALLAGARSAVGGIRRGENGGRLVVVEVVYLVE